MINFFLYTWGGTDGLMLQTLEICLLNVKTSFGGEQFLVSGKETGILTVEMTLVEFGR